MESDLHINFKTKLGSTYYRQKSVLIIKKIRLYTPTKIIG